MNAYIIAYELTDHCRDHSALYKQIRNLGNNCQPLENVWLLATDKYNEDDIYDTLNPTLGNNERLLILKVTPENRQGFLSVTAWNWMDWAAKGDCQPPCEIATE